MKRIMIMIITAIILGSIPIIIASFTNWSVNPQNWGEGGRFLSISFSCVLTIVGLFIGSEIYEYERGAK
jgi:hypothetical protein